MLSGILIQFKIDRQSEGRQPHEQEEEEEEDEQEEEDKGDEEKTFGSSGMKDFTVKDNLLPYLPSFAQISDWSPNLSYLFGGMPILLLVNLLNSKYY